MQMNYHRNSIIRWVIDVNFLELIANVATHETLQKSHLKNTRRIIIIYWKFPFGNKIDLPVRFFILCTVREILRVRSFRLTLYFVTIDTLKHAATITTYDIVISPKFSIDSTGNCGTATISTLSTPRSVYGMFVQCPKASKILLIHWIAVPVYSAWSGWVWTVTTVEEAESSEVVLKSETKNATW